MIHATIDTLATMPLHYHDLLGLIMSLLCLCLGMLLVLLHQQWQEARISRGYTFKKASWIAYLFAVKDVRCEFSMDDYLADILQ